MTEEQAERLIRAVNRIAGNFGTTLAILVGIWIVAGAFFSFYLSRHF